MAVDWTVNIGNMLTVIGFLFGGLLFVFAIRSDVNSIKAAEAVSIARLKNVEIELSKMTQAIVEIARQDERMKSFERRMKVIEEICFHAKANAE